MLAVAFWTWIWGPVGLALATPLTVCLVVLAKYVPDLEIVSVLMSDEPVMGPARSYYQRLVARDENEASALAQDYALSHGQGTSLRRGLHARPESSAARPRAGTASRTPTLATSSGRPVSWSRSSSCRRPPAEPAVSPCPARPRAARPRGGRRGRALDAEAAARPGHASPWTSRPPISWSARRSRSSKREEPAAVLIGALAGAGHALHLRYLCKRLRAHFPDLPIVVGWWGADGGEDAARDAMVAAGADRVTVSLAEACAHLRELAPLQRASDAAPVVAIASPR